MVQNVIARATWSPRFAQDWSQNKKKKISFYLTQNILCVCAVQRRPANAVFCTEVSDVCCRIHTRHSDVLSAPVLYKVFTQYSDLYEWRLLHMNSLHFIRTNSGPLWRSRGRPSYWPVCAPYLIFNTERNWTDLQRLQFCCFPYA